MVKWHIALWKIGMDKERILPVAMVTYYLFYCFKYVIGRGIEMRLCLVYSVLFTGEPMTGRKATDQWYAEIKNFNFANKCSTPKTGHFTQLVWKDSIEIGAGMAVARNGWRLLVARYSAPGNVKEKYEESIGDLCIVPQCKEHMDTLRGEVNSIFSFFPIFAFMSYNFLCRFRTGMVHSGYHPLKHRPLRIVLDTMLKFNFISDVI